MRTEKIQTIVTPKTTGYTAAAGMGLSILSGLSKNKNLKKIHKPLAWSSAAVTLLHIGLIEYYNHKYFANKK